MKIPIINDGWTNADIYQYYGGLINWIEYSYNWYFLVNGRIFATFFVGFFEQNKLLLVCGNALIFSLIVYCIDLLLPKNKINISFSLISIVLFLFVSDSIRREVYFYATMIYMMPVLLVLTSYVFLKNMYEQDIAKTYDSIILVLLVMLTTGWLEHTSFGFTVSLFVASLYFYVTKKKQLLTLIVVNFVSGITSLTMLLSPGLHHGRVFIDGDKGLLGTAQLNIFYFLDEIVRENRIVIGLFLFAILFYYARKAFFSKQSLRNAFPTIATLFLLVMLKLNNYSFHGISSPFIYYALFVLVFLIINIALIFEKDLAWVGFITLAGFFSVIPLLFSPNLGSRIFSIFIFLTIPATVVILRRVYDSYIDTRLHKPIHTVIIILVTCMFVIGCDNYVIITRRINLIQEEREQLIKQVALEQKLARWDMSKVLTLPPHSEHDLYAGASPDHGTFHYPLMLGYYKLDPKTQIAFNLTKDVLKVSIENNIAKLEMLPVYTDNLNYKYSIVKNSVTVLTSQAVNNLSYKMELPIEKGLYLFKCEITSKEGKKILVKSYTTYMR